MATRQRNATPPAPQVNGHDEAPDKPDIVVEGIEPEVDGADTIPEVAAATPAPDPGIDSLQEQLENERRRAAAAEAEVQRLNSERAKDHTAIADSRVLVVDASIKTKEGDKAVILAKIKDAKEAGDYDAEVAALDELNNVNLDLRNLALGKDRLEQQLEAAKHQPSPDDAAKEWIDQQANMGEASKRWLREHLDHLTDPVKNAKLGYAHQLALREGHAANSPGYFEALERELQIGATAATEDETVADPRPTPPPAPTPQRQTTPPAAPVSRGTQPGGEREVFPGIVQTGPGKFRLLNNEHGRAVREAAEMSGLTVAEYTAQAIKLQRGSDGQLH